MLLPLNLDSYAPVLKMLGEREDTDRSTILWIVAAFLGILLVLLVASLVRSRIRRRLRLSRGREQLEDLGARHDLNYVEQVTLERMAQAARLQNPAQLATSVDVFDQAAAAWMERALGMPWLEMEEQVARLSEIRRKLSFRYLPPERRPPNTRHLVIGQKLYILASGKPGFRLLRAPVVELDDLAIRTEFFADKTPVRLPEDQDFLCFFWSEDGGEYRFKTRVLKSVERPAPFLYLRHSDALTADEGRKTISCDLSVDVVTDWLPSAEIGRAAPSPNLFKRFEDRIQSLQVRATEVSGSGFTYTTQEHTEVNDLLRIQGGKGIPRILDGKSARVVKVTSSHGFAKFLRLSAEDRDALLSYITPRLSADAFRKKTEAHTPASA